MSIEINDELISQWEPKIQKLLENTFVRGLDKHDLEQELRIAIVKAAKGFNADRGVIFHTYLHTAMINTIRTLITKAQRRPQPQSLDALLTYQDQESTPWRSSGKISKELRDVLSTKSDMDSNLMISSVFDELALSPMEKDFLTLRMENLTMDEISATLKESAYKIRNRIKQKIGGQAEQRVLLWLNGTASL